MKVLMSDRRVALLFLTLTFLAGSSLLVEGLLFKLGTWSILALLFFSMVAARKIAVSAFPDESGEMGYQTEWISPRWSFFLGLLLLIIALSHSLFFLFEEHGQIYVGNPNLNGDFPFHWHMIKFLERGADFWPSNPHFAGDSRLRYAFGTNWLSALALRTGLPFGFVIAAPLLILTYVLWVQLWKWGGLFGLASLFLSGGGWWLAPKEWAAGWTPGDKVAWKNLFLAIFETQRGFWIALPLGIFWLRLLFEMDKNPWAEAVWRRRVLFCLWAMLPFFHLHSFVLLTLFALVFILTGRLRQNLKAFVKEGLWYVPIPLYFVYGSISKNNLNGSLRWTLNWMSETEPVLYSWGKNFGPWLLVVLVLALFLVAKFKVRGRVLLTALETRVFWIWLALGLVFAHLLLAPWAWDQSKILIWVYLGLSMTMAHLLKDFAPQWLQIGLLLLLFMPGVMQFQSGLAPQMGRTALWLRADQRALEVLVSELPVEERVLVAPSPHHPILATGQPIVAGYPGQIWAQGNDISGLEDRIRQLVLNPAPVAGLEDSQSERQNVAAFRPKYLIWGPLERRYFERERPPEESKWVEVKNSGEWLLYQR